MEIKLKPIGFVSTEEKDHFGGWAEAVADLVIDKKYEEGLKDLKDYSHLIVLYWMHEVKACELRHVPQGKVGKVPKVGIFACRCVQRPNPIGLSTVQILKVKGRKITVKGLDAISDTPILDIKPYTPQYDNVTKLKGNSIFD